MKKTASPIGARLVACLLLMPAFSAVAQLSTPPITLAPVAVESDRMGVEKGRDINCAKDVERAVFCREGADIAEGWSRPSRTVDGTIINRSTVSQ